MTAGTITNTWNPVMKMRATRRTTMLAVTRRPIMVPVTTTWPGTNTGRRGLTTWPGTNTDPAITR